MGEPARKIHENVHPTTAHAEADEMLREIGKTTDALSKLEAEAKAALDSVTAAYQSRVDALKGKIADLDKGIKTLAKKHQADLFDGSDRVDLRFGALLHSIEMRVKKARGLLERLEELGAVEAVKIVKSVDWDVLEKWSDERLIEVGTERVRKEVFAYEVFPAQAEATGQRGETGHATKPKAPTSEPCVEKASQTRKRKNKAA